ncbi:MAG: hypothetical protein KF780_12835 [Sphingomonas sp.]|nr:hypothetical protein [Sphingomonas sp.]
MRRLLAFFCVLMMALVAWSATAAQATEAFECVEISGDAAGHFEGDADQVPGDSDKGTTHHHAVCHGHCSAIAEVAAFGSPLSPPARRARTFETQVLSGSDPGQSLRPPIA